MSTLKIYSENPYIFSDNESIILIKTKTGYLAIRYSKEALLKFETSPANPMAAMILESGTDCWIISTKDGKISEINFVNIAQYLFKTKFDLNLFID
jgi:hypothetical protein